MLANDAPRLIRELANDERYLRGKHIGEGRFAIVFEVCFAPMRYHPPRCVSHDVLGSAYWPMPRCFESALPVN
jgi:hypothetical protein